MRVIARQGGIALALVLWFTAAMSLLVAGIVSQARVDLKLARIHAEQARATAAGDGAAILLLADLILEEDTEGEFLVDQSKIYEVGSNRVYVEVLPASGLINLRTASADVLRELLIKRGIEPAEANFAATGFNSWRDELLFQGSRDYVLKTLEDAFLAPTIDRRIFDALRDHTYVASVANSSRHSPSLFLSPFVKDVMVAADEYLEEEFSFSENDDVLLSDSGILRVDAIMEQDGRKWLRRQWIKPNGRTDSALRWKVWRVEPARIYLDPQRHV